ncbi:MAG TPA: transglycosylase SLT domain-containing protein [Azonexus sp.]
MFATTVFPPAFLRASFAVYALLQKFLMAAGLVFLIVLAGIQAGHSGLIEGLQSLMPSTEVSLVETEEVEAPVESSAPPALNPKMRGALDYVSKRYRVSTEALEPIFVTAQSIGKELRIDPLLIIAVIGIESGFNPFSQSVVGAKGLMQVVPRYHMDKLPEEADRSAFLDPVTNVQVGAKVLYESIRRSGGVENGLQQFGGALNDPDRRYASKVLAEKQRLEQAAQRFKT